MELVWKLLVLYSTLEVIDPLAMAGSKAFMHEIPTAFGAILRILLCLVFSPAGKYGLTIAHISPHLPVWDNA